MHGCYGDWQAAVGRAILVCVQVPSRNTRSGSAVVRLNGVLLLVFALAFGCDRDEGDYIEIPDLTATWEPKVDSGLEIPENAQLCAQDAECDDGIACTADVCQEGVYCSFIPVHEECSDGLFCDGTERCSPEDGGCVAGIAPDCNDDELCTIDSCDERTASCIHTPRDLDQDGEVDWHCFDGTDCDDQDAERGANAPEICADLEDNDCDDEVDERDCVAPPHDLCADALDISAGGTFELLVAGALDQYSASCQEEVPEVVVTFVLEEPMDVQLSAWGLLFNDGAEDLASISVRKDCSADAAILDCVEASFPAHARMRALPAGQYYATLAPDAASVSWVRSIRLMATFSAATAAPENTACGRALDISAGGRVEGSFVDVPDSVLSACSVGATLDGSTPRQPDLFYSFTTTEAHDVSLTALTLTNHTLSLSVLSTCGEVESTLACDRGTPASLVLHELPPGTYTVLVESPTVIEADFELDIRFDDPTPPPEGDDCAHVSELPLDAGRQTALLSDKMAMVETSCGVVGALDMVYAVEVDQPLDLGLRLDSGSNPIWLAVQSACGEPTTEQMCRFTYGGDFRLRDVQPGIYYVAVASFEAREVNLTVTGEEHTVSVEVGSGHGTCANATTVPASGGLFRGDTGLEADNYGTCRTGSAPEGLYRVELAGAAQVTVTASADFDVVITRLGPTTGSGLCDQLLACEDAALQDEVLQEALAAGVYYYAIDGYDSASYGTYTVEFQVEAQ